MERGRGKIDCADDLFEGERTVLHMVGDQIRETKRRISAARPWGP
jgi:hypothetical protein